MGYENLNISELEELAKRIGFREKKQDEDTEVYRLSLAEYLFQKGDVSTSLDILGVSKDPNFVIPFLELIKNYDFLTSVETAALSTKEELVDIVRKYRKSKF